MDNAWMIPPRIRVAAYVIRHRADPELLVFDHVDDPDAGTRRSLREGSVRASGWKRPLDERFVKRQGYG